MSMTDGNLEFEFFDGERYNAALGGTDPVREFVSIHTFDEHPGIATLLMSRPPTNALTRQMCREIISAAAELGARDDIAAVIVFGGHEIFCAGDDVRGAADPDTRRRRPRPPRSAARPSTRSAPSRSRRSPRSPDTRSAAG